MTFKSDAQRRAVFASMPKVHGFPLRGRGGRSRRNRAILAGAGVLGAGAAAVLLRSHAPDALAALVRPAGYMRNLRPPAGIKKVVAFSSMRPPEAEMERFMVNAPLIGKLYGRKGELYGTPLTARLWTSVMRGRGGLKPRPGLAGRVANIVDRASLWNVMGRGNLLGMLEDARVMSKGASGRTIARGKNWLIAPQRYASPKIKAKLAALKSLERRYQPEGLAEASRAATRRQRQAGRRQQISMLMRGRHTPETLTPQKVALRVQKADIRLARIRKKKGQVLRQRIQKPSRLEQQIRRPLVAVSQKLHRADWRINRWVRKQAKRAGIEA